MHQHIAAELVSRFYFDRPGLAAEALTVNASNLTAIGNDYAYARIFARQLEITDKLEMCCLPSALQVTQKIFLRRSGLPEKEHNRHWF